MLVELSITEKGQLLDGKAFYIPEEYSFLYETNFSPKSSGLLLIFDTFIITFDSKTKHFTSLDAYTNIKQWQYLDKISLPKVSKKGSLILQKWFEDPEEDRVSFDFMPEFEYTKDGIVRIKFSHESENSCQFYQFTSQGIVGLAGTKLVSIIIQNVNLNTPKTFNFQSESVKWS